MRRTGEEDEDEDVDFNPFLKETLSPETSLSLGSEIDGLDGEVDSWGKTFDNSLGVNLLKPTSEVQNSAVGDSVSRTPKKRKSCSNSQPKADTVQTKDNVSEIDYIDVLVGDLSNTAQSQKPVIDLENEDAVCTRTRSNQENEIVDDEDEYNDADFETEIQELLESDVDETEDGSINGFTLHQIGQLHCLIHEHVQLLIQVFSVCVLDSSRQHIASQVQGLIFEMLKKHNEVLAWKSVPYPSICFYPPYVCSSVPDEHPRVAPAQCSLESFPSFNTQRVCSPVNNQMLASQNMYPSKGRCVHVFNEQVGSFQNIEDSFWVPLISGLVLSILDVAPLNIVGRSMDDVSTAVQHYQHRPVKSSSDAPFERKPLFPLPSFPLYTEANSEVLRGPITSAVNMVSSTASQQLPKKTMAAALVESTMKKSVVFVTKEIVKFVSCNYFQVPWSWLMPAISAGVDGIQYELEGYSTMVSSMQIEASGGMELLMA
uniref:Uncharacterized protein n=1 Tax=Quercus lobata TaxID=97700 RepID=A0A7N2LSF3_QUELO